MRKEKYLFSFVLLTILLLTIPNVSSAKLNPRKIEHLEGNLYFEGGIHSPLKIKSLNYSFYGIPDSYHNLKTPTKYSIKTDDYGNKKLILNYKDLLSEKFRIEMSIESDSGFAFTKDIEYPYNPPKEVIEYLEDGNKTHTTANIEEASRDIIENKTTSFEVISKLTHWVNRKLIYDKSYGETTKKASWIFENRRGTCDEFSTLLISMLRSSGIPARYVAGIVYSKGGWGYHGWVEAYMGKWVSIDPTWSEVGWIDATHISLGRFKDPGEVDVGIEYKSFKDIGSSINFEAPKTGVKTTNIEEGNEILKLEASTYPKKISAGESSIINVSLSKEEIGCILTEIHLLPRKLKTGKLPFVREKKLVKICKSSKNTYFKVTPKHLKENYIYRRIGDLESSLSNSEVLNLEVNPRLGDGRSLEVDLEKSKAIVGEKVSINIITNQDYRIFSELETEDEGIETQKEGKFEVAVITENGDLVTRELRVVDNLNFRVKNISLPKNMTCGKSGNVSLVLKNMGERNTFPITFNTLDDIEIEDVNITLEKNETQMVKTPINIKGNCKEGIRIIHFGVSDKYYNKKMLIEEKDVKSVERKSNFFERISLLFNRIREFFLEYPQL